MTNSRPDSAPKMRDYYFDNMKAILIFLVVFGHFIRPIHDDEMIVNLKRLIYIFHMPMFIFVSGYFSKSVCRGGVFRAKKVFFLLKAYVLYILAIQAIYALFDYRDFSEIDFLTQSGAPWYLLAMATWYMTIPLISQIKPPVVLSVALIAALLIGYDADVGNFLSLSRIVVFSPFFYLGHYMSRETVDRITDRKLAFLIVPAAALICWFVIRNGWHYQDELAQVYANKSYDFLEDPSTGALVRLILLACATIMSWALMFFIPRRRTFVSVVGERTLAIYIVHRMIRDIMMFRGLYDLTDDMNARAIPFLLLLSVAVTGICSIKSVTKSVDAILKPRRIASVVKRA